MKKPKFPWILWIQLAYLLFWIIVTIITDEWFLFHLCGLIASFFTGFDIMEYRLKQIEYRSKQSDSIKL